MVKLFNITRDSHSIFAEYLPVGYADTGFVKVRMSDGKCVEWKAPEGEAGHSWFAQFAVKLLRQLKDADSLPAETSIAWY